MSYINEHVSAIITLTKRLQSLLFSSHLPDRLVAIAAVTSLINTKSEIKNIHARTQRTANAFTLLFSYPLKEMPTSKVSSTFFSMLVDVYDNLSSSAVDHVLSNGINVLLSQQCPFLLIKIFFLWTVLPLPST